MFYYKLTLLLFRKKYQICVEYYKIPNINIYIHAHAHEYIFRYKKICRLSYWTDQVGGEGAIILRMWARRIHSSTGVPSHVCTQQGRVNAQQGRCPLNLEGFLNANANANRSFSIRTSTGRDDRSTIRRVIARARNKHTIDSRLSWKRAEMPRLVFRTGRKIAGHELWFLYRTIADIAVEWGFLAFPVSYAFFFSLCFFLPIARDQIADRSPRSPRALVPRT